MTRRADDDRPGWRTRQRRRERDLAFLEELRARRDAGDLVWLHYTRENHSRKNDPRWKLVAILRAIDAVLVGISLVNLGARLSEWARTRDGGERGHGADDGGDPDQGEAAGPARRDPVA